MVVNVHAHAVPPQLVAALEPDGRCGVEMRASDTAAELYVGRLLDDIRTPLPQTRS
ncbi:MAG: hypothetical protein M3524_12825 [Actinomycetota bacterium]|nr:hypothetical protein [Actinomycetota bacterium]